VRRGDVEVEKRGRGNKEKKRRRKKKPEVGPQVAGAETTGAPPPLTTDPLTVGQLLLLYDCYYYGLLYIYAILILPWT
jgi:hypothetical protein